jgi:Skp family chaperone for outer membrane proteins
MSRWIYPVLALLLVPAAAARAQVAPNEHVRIGVFDPETLWKQTEVGKKYNTDLSETRDRLQSNIDKKKEEIDGLTDKMRQQQASLSEEKLQQMQKDIQNKGIELNRLNDDATREMKSQLNDVQNRFQQMLMDTLETYGKEKSFALILNKSVTDYNAPQIDITQELIARFNEMHKAPASSAPKAPVKKAPEKPKN